MDQRRLAGVGVLAAAVIALSVGTGLSRPLLVGTAGPPPVAPPPRVGDCLYAGPEGPWDRHRPDGTLADAAYSRWYAPCGDPWFGEVVGVRDRADVERESTQAGYGVGVDPCASATRAYLGRPEVPAVEEWFPVTPGAGAMDPDRRQLASGQNWLACVFGPPAWGPDGQQIDYELYTGATTTESLRGRWDDVRVRDRFGVCEAGPPADRFGVFCGAPHDREVLAWGRWIEPTQAAALQSSCSRQVALLMMSDDPTVAGALVVDVLADDTVGTPVPITADTRLESVGSAACVIRAADPARRLTSTVVGLGDGPAPITTG